MKKLLILFLFICSNVLFAQITITESDINKRMQIGNTSVEYIDSSESTFDIGQPGGVWDFDGWTYDTIVEADNLQPSEGVSSEEFPSATVVEYSTTDFAGNSTEQYNYVLLNSEEYANLGNYSSTSAAGFNTETLMTLNQPETIAYLPLNYGDSWEQTTTRSFEIESLGFTTTYTVDSDITRTVDAYGTLIFPDGSSEDVLRVKVETEVTTNISGEQPTTTYDLHYTFFSKSGAFLTVTAADHDAPDSGVIDINQVVWANGSGTTDLGETENLITDFNLEQNYPNPFNPSTTISFSVPSPSSVSIKIYDSLGREVRELVDKKLAAGKYDVNFNGTNLSSGIYFYKIEAGNFVQVKKMTLLK